MGPKMLSSVLLTNYKNSAAAAGAPFTLAGGAPAPSAHATTTLASGVGTKWAFGENSVLASAAGFAAGEITALNETLALKWGIVPQLCSGIGNVAELHFEGTGWDEVSVMRMGFFVSAASANDGSKEKDLTYNAGAGSGYSDLGFDDAALASWATTVTASGMQGSTRGSIRLKTPGQSHGFDAGWSIIPDDVRAGSFVRLNVAHVGTAAKAVNVRLRLTLRHNAVTVLYGLGFSYDGTPRNAADEAFMGADGSVLALNGVFRLVRSTSASWAEHDAKGAADRWAWTNPYTAAMEAVAAAASPLWTAWRSNGGAGDTYAATIARGVPPWVGTQDSVRKSAEGQNSTDRPMPGSFAYLPAATLRAGEVRPASWAGTFGSWIKLADGSVDLAKYGEWVAKTLDKSMFKVRTTGATWTGTASQVLDLEFRFKSANYECDNTGGAMYHLMYPGKDTPGVLAKSRGAGGMGPRGDPRSLQWYACWGYASKQPATRVSVLKQNYVSAFPVNGTTNAWAYSSSDAMSYIGMSYAAYMTAIGGDANWPWNSLKSANSYTGIELFGSNTYGGSSEPTGWTSLVFINCSEWLLAEHNGNHSRGMTNTSNESNPYNTGTALWFPFGSAVVAANPDGWMYYKVQGHSPGGTTKSVSFTKEVTSYTSILTNSTVGAHVFVLGGEPTTALDLG
jgi:hypothetical protein